MIKSYYDAMKNSEDDNLKAAMFSKVNLTRFLDVHSPSYCELPDYQMLSPTRIGISIANATFSGLVEINSSSFLLTETGIQTDTLDLQSSNVFFENGSRMDASNSFSNATLFELSVNGSSALTIVATRSQIDRRGEFPEGLSTFLPLMLRGGFNLTLTLLNETSATLRFGTNSSVFSVFVQGGVVRAVASGTDSKILVKEPRISITGQTFFEDAWFRRPYAVYQRFVCKGSPIRLDGVTCFEVPLSESNKVYLSSFTFEGTYRVLSEDLTSYTSKCFSCKAWGIIWPEILLSPWHIVLLVCVSIICLKMSGIHFKFLKDWEKKKKVST